MSNKFEVADCFIALGGDVGNIVMKTDVTPAEMAVLQVIHGGDAVRDITLRGTVDRTQRNERERVRTIYQNAKDHSGKAHVEVMFPGAAARVFENFDELELADSQFAVARGPRPETPNIDVTAEVNASPTAAPSDSGGEGFDDGLEADDEIVGDEHSVDTSIGEILEADKPKRARKAADTGALA